MSLTLYFITPLIALFLAPLFKNYYRVVSLILSLIYLYFSFYIYQDSFFKEYMFKEYISYESPLSITFTNSIASYYFVALFSVIYFFYTLFNINEKQRKDHFIAVNILIGGVYGLVLSSDIFNIYIFFEIVSISAYILTSSNKNKLAYASAIKYMIIGTVASIFLLLAIMLIYLQIGSLSLYTISNEFNTIDIHLQFLILLSLFIGFGIKAEIFPLNFWVADIYEATPSHITALFSSVVSKSYLFVFFNLAYSFEIEQKFFTFFIVVALISFIVSELSAYKANSIQRLFAYSTLGQLGIVFFAFSSQHIDIIAAGVLLILTHSIAKFTVFLSVDILKQKFNSDGIEVFTKFISFTISFSLIVSFLSILGIPPFGGFIPKLHLLTSLSLTQNYIAIAIILFISIVEAGYLFKLLYSNYDKIQIKEKEKKEKENISIPFNKTAVLLLLSFITLYIGLFPDIFVEVSKSVADYFIQGGLGV